MNRPDSNRRRNRGALAAGVLATTLLASCAQLPHPSTPATTDREALAVEPVQATRVVDAATAVLAGASDPATTDLAALAGRVSGPELELRTAARTIAEAGATPPPTGGADDLTPISSILPRQDAYPRWFATVTGPGVDQAPSIVLLRSDSARDPYTVWATPSLLPGASLPTLAAPADGVAVVAADEDTNLPLSPQAVVDHYGDVLTNGADSAFAAEFVDDAYRDGVSTATTAEAQALRAAGGTFSQERTVRPDGLLSVRTRDGGALVVAGYSWSTTSAGPSGGRVGTLDPAFAALAGESEALQATVTRAEVVVFVVPPGQGAVTVVATQSGPVGVTVE